MAKLKLVDRMLYPVTERLLTAAYGVYVREKEATDNMLLDYEQFCLAVRHALQPEEK